MKFYLPLFLLFSLLQIQAVALIIPTDSLKMEEKDGKTFILHKVEAKETLYSLSRRYNIPINQIMDSNPSSEFGLDVGQVIKVPFLKDKTVAKFEPAEGEKVHTVAPKETMFSLSRMYNVSISDIKEWNSLEDDLLDIGQQLIIKQPVVMDQPDKKAVEETEGGKTYVVKPEETLYSISRKFNVTIGELKEWNKMEDNAISIGEALIVGKQKDEPVYAGVSASEPETIPLVPPVEAERKEKEEGKEIGKHEISSGDTQIVADSDEGSTRFEEVSESGMAEPIEGSGNNRKYLALHRSAPIGTILRVRNEMNDQEVFVRVLGKLPDTGVNKNIIIKISKPAYDRLGAIDPKFRVSISYIP